MTHDDAFDARLTAAFAAARAPVEDDADAFVKKVEARIAQPDRRRLVIIGGAGSTGSAIAGSQLENLFGSLSLNLEGWLAPAAAFLTPQTLAAGVLAIMLAGFAFLLPKRA